MNDLRFGPLKGWFDPSSDYVFGFVVHRANGQVSIERLIPENGPAKSDLTRLWNRVWGK